MRSRLMCLVASVCGSMYMYVNKNSLFSGLLLENLLLSVLDCFLTEMEHLQYHLLCSAAVQTEQFMLFH